VLDGGNAGVLVDVQRPSEIAVAIERLLDDEKAATDIAERGRRRAIEAFSAEAVTSAYLDEYERVLREQRPV
jgi:glycosyltransferase involved in cell wall biosynthesis